MLCLRIELLFILALSIAGSPSNATLEVIGSGFPRTGTDTLRIALTELGYKTYHMREIIEGRLASDISIWVAQAENNCSDINALRDMFEGGGWTAAVAFPASMCYESLMKAFPDAKVIHTQRKSAEQWWESASKSIMIVGSIFPVNVIRSIVPFFRAHKILLNALYSNVVGKSYVSVDDEGFPYAYKKEFLAAYEARNAQVSKVVPRKRLLLQDHSKGWADLCKFLQKDVPEIPYPHVNTRADYFRTAKKVDVRVSIAFILFMLICALFAKKLIGLFRKAGKSKDV